MCKLYLNKVVERKRERERERKKERDGRKEGNDSYLLFPWSNWIPRPSPSLPVLVVHSVSVCLVPEKHLGEAWDSSSIDTWPPPPPWGTLLTYTALLLGLEKGRSPLHRQECAWDSALHPCGMPCTSVHGNLASCLAPNFSTVSLSAPHWSNEQYFLWKIQRALTFRFLSQGQQRQQPGHNWIRAGGIKESFSN